MFWGLYDEVTSFICDDPPSGVYVIISFSIIGSIISLNPNGFCTTLLILYEKKASVVL